MKEQFTYTVVEREFKATLGEVLTLVEASTPPGIQANSLKQLVKQTFNRRIESLKQAYEVTA